MGPKIDWAYASVLTLVVNGVIDAQDVGMKLVCSACETGECLGALQSHFAGFEAVQDVAVDEVAKFTWQWKVRTWRVTAARHH